MNIKIIFQTIVGAVGYGAWALMSYIDPTLRPDFLKFNIAMAVGTIGLVLRDMRTTQEGIGGAAPANKESGHSLPGLLAMLALGSTLALAGCVTPIDSTPKAQRQATQMNYTQACSAWGAALSTAIQLRIAGKLTPNEIDQITLLDSQVSPICTGPLPTDSTAVTQQVTAAVTTLTLLELAKTEKQP